ncbi:MAG: hypothetical protein ACOZCL_10460 [Bacillota bacterium]
MSEKRPFLVTLIGDMSILSALLLILTLFPSLTSRLGIELGSSIIFSNTISKGAISIALLVAAYGYMKLKKWGYWLMISIDILFLAVSIISAIQAVPQSTYTGIITSVVSLMFILPTKEYFYRSNLANQGIKEK